MDFHIIKSAVAKQFERMSKHQMFRTGVEKDVLWAGYLSAFPVGSNPIYKTRTEHDCQCCKQFIRAVGNVVAIIDGRLETVWDGAVSNPAYTAVCASMRELVLAHPITDAFLHYERTAGTEKSLQDTLDGVKTWSHFFVNMPTKFVMPGADIPTKLNEHRTAYEVLKRGLNEIKIEDLDAVLELIAQNSLYRGEEHKASVTQFRALSFEAGLLPVGEREGFYWQRAMTLPASVSRFRNTAIGTLLVDLAEGKELEDAVKAFESKVAPTNYKRPTALVTKAMIEKAKGKIEELGLTSALNRRYALLGDISVNDILFADRGARKALSGGVFDDLAAAVPVKQKSLDKVEEVSIEKFLADILPGATALEVLVENGHTGNLVSLVAPQDPTAAQLFKWGNNFSWSYNGDVADSMKERVKAAGGNVTGDLCCRLAWECADDLDFHMRGPGGEHIYYVYRGQVTHNGGMLDVDANGMDGLRKHPVENIFYKDRRKMAEGTYQLLVNNFGRREGKPGFEVEIEFDGQVHSMSFDKSLRQGETVEVAHIAYKAGVFEVTPKIPSSQTVRQVWGVSTNTFQPVDVVMLSPNHWGGQGVGNKHYFFMLRNCRNEGQARGFYNEFLKAELNEHRKVIEMVGAKMKTEAAGEQLSGLGFSSTQRNAVLCKVTGAFSRVVKIVF